MKNQYEVQAEKLSKEELEAIAEFRDSLAYKILSQFHEDKSQELKDTALCLNDKHVVVKIDNQEYIQVVTVKEQLCELQGRQNQMIAERRFITGAVKRYAKLRSQEATKRNVRKPKRV